MVELNVRGRDVASFVAEAIERLARDVELPVGYCIRWGGQFENIEAASNRLTIVEPLGDRSELEVLALAASLEALSEHPLVAAVVRAAQARGLTASGAVSGFRALPGAGVEGVVDGVSVQILQPDADGAPFGDLDRRLEALAQAGVTPAVVLAVLIPVALAGLISITTTVVLYAAAAST